MRSYHLGTQPLKQDQQQRLDDFFPQLQDEADHFLGYPCTREFDYLPLYPFLGMPLNNVGDPVQWNKRQFDSPNQQFCGTRCKDPKNLAQKYY